ncbi:MAG TPA: NAD-dependent epimerase/dehydratase family protein [Aquihabitans sp.]|jgi:UDP-glucose 4-epimerase|nr:NAD-dependent epimerase/dehydratase family protein [Aquihabitans sp.]
MLTLVTGGAGFIGSNLADALLERGHEVRILDDLSTGRAENLPGDATFFEGTITDVELLDQAVDGAEVVFHQAALGSVARSVQAPLMSDEVNTHGTLAVLDAAHRHGVRRVVQASSSSIYGGADQRPTPESAPLVPRSPYAVTKMVGEHYARVYAELFGLETVALRYFNVYGPRQRPDSEYAAVIPRFIADLRAGRPPEVHGDGGQSRDFAFIDDVVAANLAAAEAPAAAVSGKAFNIAGGSERSLLEMLDILREVLGVDTPAVHVDPRAGDVRHSSADLSAAAAAFGYRPAVDFREGLTRTVDHVSAAEADGVAAAGPS